MRTHWTSIGAVVVSLLMFGATSTLIAATSNDGVWTDMQESAIVNIQQRDIIPAQYRTIASDMDALRKILRRAPVEGGFDLRTSPTTLSIPLPDGSFSRFHIAESPIMAPELAAKFPEIKTYIGQGIDDRTAGVRLDITPAGFHAMILSADHTIFVDPYGRGNTTDYISYYRRDLLPNPENHFEEIDVVDPDGEMAREISRLVGIDRIANVGEQLRTYRLALAATGEYTAYHGGTVQAGMAAIVTAMNRVNGVYEKEVAIRMVLVANNDQIVYTNAATDPYTNNNGSTMLGQNQTNLDAVIGSANYDIGHVFSTGGGGIAYLGCVCVAGTKARGVTGLSAPIGDGFYIDYVAHEMGHQFGANHPFNSVTSSCGGGNRNASTAYEPGSGSTIMAYAGICGADDLQPHSDDYFHIISLNEIIAYTQSSSGNACPVITNTGNNPPTVSIPSGGNTIPIGTPFYLTGSGSDPDGDTLTFCWEEYDLGPAGSPNAPSGNAPIFRSFKGTGNPTRTFPRMTDILGGTQTIGEILPSYTRNLAFRLTARDNRSGGGGIARSASLTIGVNAAAGPFTVISPTSWLINSTDTVKWNVANTNTPPINCSAVNILLSTDGGLSFPVTLASATPNDGVEVITVPNLQTETARIKIEPTNNIFFAINNYSFSIGSVSTPALVSPPTTASIPSTSVDLVWRSAPGALSYYLQVATNTSFTTLIVNDSTMADSTRSLTGLTNNATYYWRVKARNASGSSGWSPVWNFKVVLPPAAPTLASPPNNSVDQSTSLTLRWNVLLGATGFHLQLSSDSTFATTLVDDTTLTTVQRNVNVANATRYFWRVRAKNAGGWGGFSAIWNFTTILTSVVERPGMPTTFELSQNYPNPFNPTTVIEFALPRESHVSLAVYNLLGERVAQLVDERRSAGYYAERFNAEHLASGLYFYKIQAGDFVQTRKLMLVR